MAVRLGSRDATTARRVCLYYVLQGKPVRENLTTHGFRYVQLVLKGSF
jgi:hypothetical protein